VRRLSGCSAGAAASGNPQAGDVALRPPPCPTPQVGEGYGQRTTISSPLHNGRHMTHGITCTWWAATDGQPPPAAGDGHAPDPDARPRRLNETRQGITRKR